MEAAAQGESKNSGAARIVAPTTQAGHQTSQTTVGVQRPLTAHARLDLASMAPTGGSIAKYAGRSEEVGEYAGGAEGLVEVPAVSRNAAATLMRTMGLRRVQRSRDMHDFAGDATEVVVGVARVQTSFDGS